MPLLSLAMIVKNEAEMLPAFFQACRGVFDEMIVVDTGSTDSTVDIAEAAGATVLHFEWCNDFAAARNVSLQACTGDWVVYLDADERLSAQCGQSLRHLAEVGIQSGVGAARIQMRNLLPNHQYSEVSLLRVFRNDPSIHFKHRIHEDATATVMAFLAQSQLRLVTLEGEVVHLGYQLAQAQKQNKRERDCQLLSHIISESPTDLYAHFKLLELARYWNDKDLWTQATQAAVAALDSVAESEWTSFHYAHEMAVLLAQSLAFADLTTAVQQLEQLIRHLPEAAAHSQYHLGYLHEQMGQYEVAERHYKSCLRLPALREPAYAHVRPLLGLCRCALHNNDFKRAARCVQTALPFSTQDPELRFVAQQLIQLALHHGESSIVFELIQSFDALNALTETERLFLAQAHILNGSAHQALAVLTDYIAVPIVGFSALICNLCAGVNRSVDVAIEQAEADSCLRAWLEVILRSRNGLLTQQFIHHSHVLHADFPWLQSEIERLKQAD